MKPRLRNIIYFVASLLIVALLSSAVTLWISKAKRKNEVVLSAEQYAELAESYSLTELANLIEENSYYDVADREKLLSAAANGMLGALGDDYAVYYTNEEYISYLETTNGEYSGVGILIGQPDDRGVPVLNAYEGNPAALAGVQTGDLITHIDGDPTAGMTLDEVSFALSGEAGSVVSFTIIRTYESGGAEVLEIPVTLGAVNIKRVHHALYNQRTGYIRIDMFTGNCVTEFEEAVRDLKDRGMKSLVLDLRNNPGGSLNAVVSIADIILGKCDIVSIRGKGETEGEVYTSDEKKIDVPIAVLVNENSASASEILSAAIQETGAGIVVGMPTYGKGIVQTTMQLSSNQGWVKITTDAYFTASGRSIHGIGVQPDIEIDLDEDLKGLTIEQISENHQDRDAQLWAALDYVREKALQAS